MASFNDVKEAKRKIAKKIWVEKQELDLKNELIQKLNRYVVGMATVSTDSGFELVLLLQPEIIETAPALLFKVIPDLQGCGVSIRVNVARPFVFAQGLQPGSGIRLAQGGIGKIGLFLKDAGSTHF